MPDNSEPAKFQPENETKTGLFAALSIRNFRFLVTGTTLSSTASWIQQVIMNWMAYDLTGSGAVLGTVNLARSVAMFGLIPVTGLLIDRVNRRRLMVLTNAWMLIISLVLGILLIVSKAHVAYLYVFSFLGGVAISMDVSLRQVMIFDIVPRKVTPNALALVQTGWSITRSFGPAIGGFLILWFGAGGNFIVQAAIYGIIAVNIYLIRFPPQSAPVAGVSPLQNIKEGFRYVLSQPVTRTFMLIGLIYPILIIPIFVVVPPIFAKDVFHGGPEGLGYQLSAIGVGGIIGGLVSASMLHRFERRGLLQVALLVLVSVTLVGFAFSRTLWMALPFLSLAGFFEVIFLTSNQTLLQLSIPDKVRGQVTSIVNLNSPLSPLGGVILGFGSDLFGGPKIVTIAMCSITAGSAICLYLCSRTIRDYRLSQAMANRNQN